LAFGPCRWLLCVCGLALVLASGADARTAKKPKQGPQPGAAAGSGHCRGAELFPCGPVYNGNDYLGEDPDPFIRLMIKRDLGAKYGGAD